MQAIPSKTLRRALSVATCAAGAVLIATSAHAVTYSLAGDFSDSANPNGPWSFTQGATLLNHHPQPSDGNAANAAAENGFYGAISDFSQGPFLLKTTRDGGDISGGYGDGDFLAGDVVAHSTNPNGGAELFINWTAPTAGVLSFTSLVWYAHSPVTRSGEVGALLDGSLLGSVTVTNGVSRSNALSLSGSNLAVDAGDVLAFRFSPTAGQTFGSLTGISATVDFTSTAVPEPSTWAIMIVGFGLAGGSLRARRRLAPQA